MKQITVVVPCYNEQENVQAMHDALTNLFHTELTQYDYDILFIDNCSTDRTESIIESICQTDTKTKAIFNSRNFGQFNSPYYGLLNADGDCAVLLACDFQDPVELIPKFIKNWEDGYKVVIGVKTSSKENRIMYWLRGQYYKLIKKMSDVEQIEQFTGFALYDSSFIEILQELKDPTPFLRGIVAELAPSRISIEYEQPKRKAGKTHNNWYTLYDAAMLSFTSYTKAGLRIATFFGFFISAVSFTIGIIYLILKLVNWYGFAAGSAPMIIGMFFLGGVQLIFIGFLGEYIMSMNNRIMNRPLVIERKRINF
jgi:glycosyltransferase involved in cell wall biosynthesis